MAYTYRRIDISRRPTEVRHRTFRPRGRYAEILDLIGYGKGPKSPQAAALAAS
ncbi:hypothetical protein [Maritimibacter sp. UBA3975]|uniref:hypothetical protein n=1 Tax=Maritimibacter sp. UBA3975 TaxID=1946833 RepID=UPI0025C16F11|nr:hypothetical protein [Maritimibacter sp. UBA3975]|tara:strand:- start:3673 stop:3831 length:159 start_codon:yes stop_codon:yes gene_type:complete